jgi:hypothetical protein
MIATADAVALVQVDSIERIEPPIGLQYPNRVVTLTVKHVLRGAVPTTFAARVASSEVENPSLDANSLAIVFLERARSAHPVLRNVAPQVLDGGFVTIADLVRPGDLGLGIVAYSAIQEAVSEQTGPVRLESWSIPDDVAAPFIDLLSSSNSNVRHWAVDKALSGGDVSPSIGNALIQVLDDRYISVSRAAAYRLMQSQYDPATKPLREYAARLQREKRTSELNDVLPYLEGRRIKEGIGQFPNNLSQSLKSDLSRTLTAGTPHVWVDVTIYADGRIELESTDVLSGDSLERLKNYLRSSQIPVKNGQAHFLLELWLVGNRIRIKLTNKPK